MYRNQELLNNARELRKNMTRQERHLWYDFLRFNPYKFYKQKPIGPYVTDFCCPSEKLVIELDGGQHYEPEQMLCDQKRTAFLHENGFRVLRFTNLEIDKNFEGVCERINIDLKAPLSQPDG